MMSTGEESGELKVEVGTMDWAKDAPLVPPETLGRKVETGSRVLDSIESL